MNTSRQWVPSDVIVGDSVVDHPVTKTILQNCKNAVVHVVELSNGESDAELLTRTLRSTRHQAETASSLARKSLLLVDDKNIFQSMAAGAVPERRCFNFVKILPYSGVCRASCSYCWFKDPVLIPKVNVAFFEHLPGQLEKLIQERGRTQVLTFTHYKTDCFAIDHLTGFAGKLCAFFEKVDGCYVQFLTKQADVRPILQFSPKRGTIVCFSINAETVTKILEPGTSEIPYRLRAAQCLSNKGIPVLLRVDPMFSFDGWQDAYRSLALAIAETVRPQKITLGTPRFQSASEMERVVAAVETPKAQMMMGREVAKMGLNKPGLPRGGVACESMAYFKNMPMSYPAEMRVNLYASFIDAWRELGVPSSVGLCEEPAEIWDACGLQWHGDKTHDCTCNFIPSVGDLMAEV